MVGLSGAHRPGEAAMLEAAVPSSGVRDLGQRVASVERAVPLSRRPASRLERSHASLAEQFVEGVEAYERLVAAAAGYVAEDGHIRWPTPSTRPSPA